MVLMVVTLSSSSRCTLVRLQCLSYSGGPWPLKIRQFRSRICATDDSRTFYIELRWALLLDDVDFRPIPATSDQLRIIPVMADTNWTTLLFSRNFYKAEIRLLMRIKWSSQVISRFCPLPIFLRKAQHRQCHKSRNPPLHITLVKATRNEELWIHQ